VSQSARLVDLVRSRIDDFLDGRGPILASIAPEASAFERFSRDFLRFGKRYRALFCYWGWQAVQDADDDDAVGPDDLPAIVAAASALELFHAAALVHDDLIDSSDTRRGMPSAHRLFEREHTSRDWVGDAPRFGRSAAVLLGDLLLCWADELFDDAVGLTTIRADGRAARAEFNRMRLEVTAGQYLDIVAEAAWPHVRDVEAVRTAERVIVFKSAKYSIESPLVVGATLGGATLPQLAALRSFGLPLGVAFQLRDDLLGVFGDSEITGKPAGDDLLEGKRTMLIALTRQALPVSARRTGDELLGDPELDDEQIRMLQETIRASGAIDEVERLITANVDRAREAVEDAPIAEDAREALWALADSVTVRVA
jgi:geranylgeranyl diphosphate synthase, type I